MPPPPVWLFLLFPRSQLSRTGPGTSPPTIVHPPTGSSHSAHVFSPGDFTTWMPCASPPGISRPLLCGPFMHGAPPAISHCLSLIIFSCGLGSAWVPISGTVPAGLRRAASWLPSDSGARESEHMDQKAAAHIPESWLGARHGTKCFTSITSLNPNNSLGRRQRL